jgi:RNA polymerase sigma-70 factor (ECF subfamily)
VADDEFRQQALQHLDALHNLAVYLTRNGSEAEDLVQETYVRALRFSHRFQPGTHLRAWMFQILRNTFLTFYRLREREPALGEAGVADGPAPMFHDAPAQDGESQSAHMDLEGALRRIPEEFRTPLMLAEIEGLSLDDVARIMDCPVGTVKSRIFRAKERLRSLLKDYGQPGHERAPRRTPRTTSRTRPVTSCAGRSRGGRRPPACVGP